MTAPVALRDPAVISAESDTLRTAAKSGSAFHQGARDALRWLLVGGPGPLTGGMTGLPIPLRAVVAELSAAEAVIYGRPSGLILAALLGVVSNDVVNWPASPPAPRSGTPARCPRTARAFLAAAVGASVARSSPCPGRPESRASATARSVRGDGEQTQRERDDQRQGRDRPLQCLHIHIPLFGLDFGEVRCPGDTDSLPGTHLSQAPS
jgi:hypothetical protein